MNDSTSTSEICAHATATVERALSQSLLPDPNNATILHISACPRCRGALALLISELDPALRPPLLDTPCERSLPDLPAFVDAERGSPVTAASRYPHVWWHLYTCAACAEVYELTHTLLAADRRDDLPPLPES